MVWGGNGPGRSETNAILLKDSSNAGGFSLRPTVNYPCMECICLFVIYLSLICELGEIALKYNALQPWLYLSLQ